jgi:prolyl-tRNA synthetase
VYSALQGAGVEVLFDDRDDVSAGEKFADSDLIGIPHRVVVSERSMKEGGVEIKKRTEERGRFIAVEDLLKEFSNVR